MVEAYSESLEASREFAFFDTLSVDWNDIRLHLHGVQIERMRRTWEPEQFFRVLDRKVTDFIEKSAAQESDIKREFEMLQQRLALKDHDMGASLDSLHHIVLKLVKVCKYLEGNCEGLRETFDKLITDGHLSRYEITQLAQTCLPLRQLMQLLEVPVIPTQIFRVLEGQVQNMYLKLFRDCYAPGAPLSQSLLHEEPLRMLKFAIRDFTQCLQTAVGWRDLEQYLDTPDYSSLYGLVVMLAISFVSGFDNHYMSHGTHPQIFVSASLGTIAFSSVISCVTNKAFKPALVAFATILVCGHIIVVLGSVAKVQFALDFSEIVIRIVDGRILVIRYIADTVHIRRQTHWMALALSLEAVGICISFALQVYAGWIQGGLWLLLLIFICAGFEDTKKSVSSPAHHQGRSLTATGMCIWILFISNVLAESAFPSELLAPSVSTCILFLSIAAVLFVFSFITMHVKNRSCVLLAFVLASLSLVLESDHLISLFPGQLVVVLTMHLANTISITFLVKKLPLKQAEGFWNSAFLSVLMVQLGELVVHFVEEVATAPGTQSDEFLWTITALSAFTCGLILVAWKMLDFQVVKNKVR